MFFFSSCLESYFCSPLLFITHFLYESWWLLSNFMNFSYWIEGVSDLCQQIFYKFLHFRIHLFAFSYFYSPNDVCQFQLFLNVKNSFHLHINKFISSKIFRIRICLYFWMVIQKFSFDQYFQKVTELHFFLMF